MLDLSPLREEYIGNRVFDGKQMVDCKDCGRRKVCYGVVVYLRPRDRNNPEGGCGGVTGVGFDMSPVSMPEHDADLSESCGEATRVAGRCGGSVAVRKRWLVGTCCKRSQSD